MAGWAWGVVRAILQVLRLCSVVAAVVLTLAPGAAWSLSAGCLAVQGGALDNFGGNVTGYAGEFDAGDTLVGTYHVLSGAPQRDFIQISDGAFLPVIQQTSNPTDGSTVTLVLPTGGLLNPRSAISEPNHGTGTDSLTFTCTPAPIATTTTVSSSQNPSAAGETVTFTATVASGGGTPTGTVTFKNGATVLGTGTLDGSGQATLATSTLGFGVHSITAEYGGDASFSSSTSPALTQSVNTEASTTTLTAAPNPSDAGQGVTLTATVTNSSNNFVPTGTIEFMDVTTGATLGSVFFIGDWGPIVRSITVSTLAPGSHALRARYSGGNYLDGVSVPKTVNPSDSNTVTQAVNQAATATALASSRNPTAFGESVTFTATVTNGGATPTGTVTFRDGTTVLGTGFLDGSGSATFTTSALALGAHSITAEYGGDANFDASTSPVLMQIVEVPADSIALRALQRAATRLAAQASGHAVAGAIDAAIGEGFSGGGVPFAMGLDGVRLSFAAEPQPVDDDFVLAHHGAARQALQPALPQTQWLPWFEVRGSGWDVAPEPTDIAGRHVNALAGLSHRLTPDLLIGAFGGYESFDYTSQSLTGRLSGEGWTAGGYFGWRPTPGLRLDGGIARSAIGYDATAGAAIASFPGRRWLATLGLTGTHEAAGFTVEPSLRAYGLWEHEDAYVDSLATAHPERDFMTGRASGGVKVSYPLFWGEARLVPYAGLHADYANSWDDAADLPLPPGFIHDWSARLTSGVAATLPSGATLSLGGELGGLGSDASLWSVRGRAGVPF